MLIALGCMFVKPASWRNWTMTVIENDRLTSVAQQVNE